MSQLVIFPEMLEAGVEALTECRYKSIGSEDTVISVYLAMEAIKQIAIMRRKHEEQLH